MSNQFLGFIISPCVLKILNRQGQGFRIQVKKIIPLIYKKRIFGTTLAGHVPNIQI